MSKAVKSLIFQFFVINQCFENLPIGPNIEIKHPSNNPMISAKTIMDSNSNPWKYGAAINNIVQIPIETNEICCNKIRLTLGRSAIFPKIKRPNPEVMPMQETKTLPSLSGMV